MMLSQYETNKDLKSEVRALYKSKKEPEELLRRVRIEGSNKKRERRDLKEISGQI